VLIPLWALASLAFLRSLETRSLSWAALTGIRCRSSHAD